MPLSDVVLLVLYMSSMATAVVLAAVPLLLSILPVPWEFFFVVNGDVDAEAAAAVAVTAVAALILPSSGVFSASKVAASGPG